MNAGASGKGVTGRVLVDSWLLDLRRGRLYLMQNIIYPILYVNFEERGENENFKSQRMNERTDGRSVGRLFSSWKFSNHRILHIHSMYIRPTLNIYPSLTVVYQQKIIYCILYTLKIKTPPPVRFIPFRFMSSFPNSTQPETTSVCSFRIHWAEDDNGEDVNKDDGVVVELDTSTWTLMNEASEGRKQKMKKTCMCTRVTMRV